MEISILNKEEIKAIRKEVKLGQTEFGEKIGVSYRTVQNWESGSRQPKHSSCELMRGLLVEFRQNGKIEFNEGNLFYEKNGIKSSVAEIFKWVSENEEEIFKHKDFKLWYYDNIYKGVKEVSENLRSK